MFVRCYGSGRQAANALFGPILGKIVYTLISDLDHEKSLGIKRQGRQGERGLRIIASSVVTLLVARNCD